MLAFVQLKNLNTPVEYDGSMCGVLAVVVLVEDAVVLGVQVLPTHLVVEPGRSSLLIGIFFYLVYKTKRSPPAGQYVDQLWLLPAK